MISKNVKIVKVGYAGTTYINFKNNTIVKEYKVKKNVKYSAKNITTEKLFATEIESVKRMSKIKNTSIQTPVIIFTDYNKLKWEQKKFEGLSFYRYMIKGCNIFLPSNTKSDYLFQEFGKYLAEFHNTYFIKKDKNSNPISFLHGDLSSHNIMFINNEKLFIFDPGYINKGSIYTDLACFMLNFYALNPFYKLLINNKKLNIFKNKFLNSYIKNSSFAIDKTLLKKYILKKINDNNDRLRSGIIYKAKKLIINYYRHKLYKKINTNKIII